MTMDKTLNDCGCCAGIGTDTPAAKFNRPGLPAIAYRIGRQPEFKASLLARLSSTDYPALARLTTRDEDDWTIALLDGCATLADVLTFYQERIANESYLRTAVERRSILELAELIGYQLAPGVAAGTAFAFSLETSPGQPELAARPVAIPVGTRVQSIPDPGQSAQFFETTAEITARVEWNAMPARSGETLGIAADLTELYLAGTSTQLQPGDAILIVGNEQLSDANGEHWDVRWLDSVTTDAASNLTRITWSPGLGSHWPASTPAAKGIRVYALRVRAALFGNNAPHPSMLDKTKTVDWQNGSIDPAHKRIDLDAVYQKIVPGSWLVLAGGSKGHSPMGYVELYRVDAVAQRSQAQYGMSGKYSFVIVHSAENLDTNVFGLRETVVLAQSEPLVPASRPLRYPVFGETLDLQERQPGLQPGQLIAVSGKRQRIGFAADTDPAAIKFPDFPGRKPLADESFLLFAPPKSVAGKQVQTLLPADLDPSPPPGKKPPTGTIEWTVLDHDGTKLTIQAPAGSVELRPAAKSDEALSEVCTLAKGANAVVTDLDHTTLTLTLPLANCYDRSTVTVNANVAPATHGESVAEIGGSGDAGLAGQRFMLKQAPLTYRSSATAPSGRSSTLSARINGIEWREVDTLYGAAPGDRVYVLRHDDDGNTRVEFGDGSNGARLPSGQNNVRFSYRKGIGTAGNLRANQINMLLTRPLGVKAATNPTPASGGQDPETQAEARNNAPLRVLTLDRAVSIEDYADYARAFAGIAKAHAVWIADTAARGIHVTVGAPAGKPFTADSAVLANLTAALRNFGDALLPLTVQPYADARFTLQAMIKVDRAYDNDAVLAGVANALRAAYAFERRAFGQPVTLDEVYAVIQAVDGVIAADINQLYRLDTGPAAPQPAARLLAALPAPSGNGSVSPAELLTLDSGPIALGVMP